MHSTRRLLAVAVALTAALSACKSSKEKEKPGESAAGTEKPVTRIGVSPENFKCESLAPLAELKAILDDTLRPRENPFEPPRGAPRGCVYIRTIQLTKGQQEALRKKRRDELKEQLKKQNKKWTKQDEDELTVPTELDEMWSYDVDCRDTAEKEARKRMAQHTANAGDAGVTTVDVGKTGLDHHGVALLFIDDDTPCHVRIIGPIAEARTKIAKLIAPRLTMKTAPMTMRRINQLRAERRKKADGK